MIRLKQEEKYTISDGNGGTMTALIVELKPKDVWYRTRRGTRGGFSKLQHMARAKFRKLLVE